MAEEEGGDWREGEGGGEGEGEEGGERLVCRHFLRSEQVK